MSASVASPVCPGWLSYSRCSCIRPRPPALQSGHLLEHVGLAAICQSSQHQQHQKKKKKKHQQHRQQQQPLCLPPSAEDASAALPTRQLSPRHAPSPPPRPVGGTDEGLPLQVSAAKVKAAPCTASLCWWDWWDGGGGGGGGRYCLPSC